MESKRRVISLLVDNQSGVLARVSNLFCRRGFNIDTLTVSATNDPAVSRITLTITSDDRVFMAVHVTKDEVLRYIDTNIGQVPEIATREINTAVLVDDGQTVVIGGVYEFNDANSVAKVPFLGDVPFLGNLFKKKSRNKEKAELLIFLTPKVMRVEKRA